MNAGGTPGAVGLGPGLGGATCDRTDVPCGETGARGVDHDTAHLAARCPAGIIFIPSAGGRGHVPGEWTERSDMASGARVLAATLTRMDAVPELVTDG